MWRIEHAWLLRLKSENKVLIAFAQRFISYYLFLVSRTDAQVGRLYGGAHLTPGFHCISPRAIARPPVGAFWRAWPEWIPFDQRATRNGSNIHNPVLPINPLKGTFTACKMELFVHCLFVGVAITYRLKRIRIHPAERTVETLHATF